jgi:hypothetical protein
VGAAHAQESAAADAPRDAARSGARSQSNSSVPGPAPWHRVRARAPTRGPSRRYPSDSEARHDRPGMAGGRGTQVAPLGRATERGQARGRELRRMASTRSRSRGGCAPTHAELCSGAARHGGRSTGACSSASRNSCCELSGSGGGRSRPLRPRSRG